MKEFCFYSVARLDGPCWQVNDMRTAAEVSKFEEWPPKASLLRAACSPRPIQTFYTILAKDLNGGFHCCPLLAGVV